jgi:hypothetical protein
MSLIVFALRLGHHLTRRIWRDNFHWFFSSFFFSSLQTCEQYPITRISQITLFHHVLSLSSFCCLFFSHFLLVFVSSFNFSFVQYKWYRSRTNYRQVIFDSIYRMRFDQQNNDSFDRSINEWRNQTVTQSHGYGRIHSTVCLSVVDVDNHELRKEKPFDEKRKVYQRDDSIWNSSLIAW